MKIIFAGTPDFAVPTLQALNTNQHNVAMVLTQPDRPSGRGRKMTFSPVKEYALEHDIPVYQPKSLKNTFAIDMIKAVEPDLIVVIAYGLIIPQAILDLPKYGCVCLHLSLLPRWRGAAPAQRAIIGGDKLTGVTLMQMDSGIDTGECLAYATHSIAKNATTDSLYQELGQIAAQTLMQNLPGIEKGTIISHTQDNNSMTYAAKISKDEALINWELGAQQIERIIRAMISWPVAYTFANGERLRIWQANVISEFSDARPGMIVGAGKHGIDVACGGGILSIQKLQWPGGKVQTAEQALNANNTPLKIGLVLGLNE